MGDPSIPWPEWGSAPRGHEHYHDHHHSGEVLARVRNTPVGWPVGTEAAWTVIHCTNCLLNHVVPRPDDATLRGYYQHVFYQQSKPEYVARYEEDRPWWEFWHGQTCEAAEAALGSPAAVLDCGTGPGLFLDTAQARGWDTSGLELNLELANRAIARGHEIYHMSLGEFLTCRGDLTYDLLHLYEVLEHVPDPQECVLEATALLRPNGLLHVVVPNDYNVLQLAACAKLDLPHWWVQPPEHLTYFTAKTLQLLLRRCGFDILDLRGTYPLEFALLEGRNYVGDDMLGREVHRERMRLELAMAQAGLTGHLLTWYRENVQHAYRGAIGRELVCLARKRP
jgi:2-polyprenyl-3-methyl-5-hydroxy-6-metoxy-1,4-benzoquinol methylase